MRKQLSVLALIVFVALNAQQTANRFFYELTFKPKKDSARTEKVMTILDITTEMSRYQDFTVPAQDSIIKEKVSAMEKSGVWSDMMKSIKMPKFTHKVKKTYPDMNVQYTDQISMKTFGYDDAVKFDWKISPEKATIGEYKTQKATAEFAGRTWTAWFSQDIPFPDGPYKFYGLPGLIVKLEDEGKNYSWELKGNKTVENWEEMSYAEKINQKYGMSQVPVIITREKFEKSYDNFKADPLAEMRPYMTPELMGRKMPGSDKTVGEYIKDQEKMAKDFFTSNNNPIEIKPEKK